MKRKHGQRWAPHPSGGPRKRKPGCVLPCHITSHNTPPRYTPLSCRSPVYYTTSSLPTPPTWVARRTGRDPGRAGGTGWRGSARSVYSWPGRLSGDCSRYEGSRVRPALKRPGPASSAPAALRSGRALVLSRLRQHHHAEDARATVRGQHTSCLLDPDRVPR